MIKVDKIEKDNRSVVNGLFICIKKISVVADEIEKSLTIRNSSACIAVVIFLDQA